MQIEKYYLGKVWKDRDEKAFMEKTYMKMKEFQNEVQGFLTGEKDYYWPTCCNMQV